MLCLVAVSWHQICHVSTLLEKTFVFMSGVVESHKHVPLEVPLCHVKDPLLPWVTQLKLTRRIQEIVASFNTSTLAGDFSIHMMVHTIQRRPPDEGITLVELYAGIGTSLATVLEASLKVRWYIHMK